LHRTSCTALQRRGLLLTLFFFCARAFSAEPLPALDAERLVTVSGVSSGAYFAVQFHVAHSAIVKGAGAIAGGPYYCAQGSIKTAYYNCMTPSLLVPLPSTAVLKSQTEELARAGRIDPTSHLATARAWLFTGSKDETVTRAVVEGLNAFYSGYNTRTVIVRDKAAGHAMVTEDAGNKDCGASKPPFINDCDYDAAGELLKHLLGNLTAPLTKPAGRLARFDQTAFGGHAISMDDEGFVYIPNACESQRCRVHVVFHGCRQGRVAIKDQFAREAGYNRWADHNRIIVLYPQATTRWWPTYNPNGCWDWWGYTGAQYHTKEGAQIRAVKGMLDRLSEPKR
jgi:poly(3-hydroxybutyrate) depolymerase